jgi:hypothetical protein
MGRLTEENLVKLKDRIDADYAIARLREEYQRRVASVTQRYSEERTDIEEWFSIEFARLIDEARRSENGEAKGPEAVVIERIGKIEGVTRAESRPVADSAAGTITIRVYARGGLPDAGGDPFYFDIPFTMCLITDEPDFVVSYTEDAVMWLRHNRYSVNTGYPLPSDWHTPFLLGFPVRLDESLPVGEIRFGPPLIEPPQNTTNKPQAEEEEESEGDRLMRFFS